MTCPLERLPEAFPLPRWLEYGLLVAVSGGADSTALLHFTARYARDFGLPGPAVGHVDHGLRGEESNGDADFVRNLAGEYGLRYFQCEIEPSEWRNDDSGSREAAARTIRYDFLRRTAEENGFRYVATAHTADDQTETVLLRVLRGTGPAGLAGIPRFRRLGETVTLVRPLLDTNRTEILRYLESLGKTYRVDSSNETNDFTRNRLRNKLLPILRNEFNPDVDAAIRRLARLAGENEGMLDDLIAPLIDGIVLSQTPRAIVLDAGKLRNRSPAMIREIFVRLWSGAAWPLRGMGFEQWNDLAAFFLGGNGIRLFRGGVEGVHFDGTFTLRRVAEGSGALR